MADHFKTPKPATIERIRKHCKNGHIPTNVKEAAEQFLTELQQTKISCPVLSPNQGDLYHHDQVLFIWQKETCRLDEVIFWPLYDVVMFEVITPKGTFKSKVNNDYDWIKTLLSVLLVTGETMPPVVIVDKL